jgi:hypothetical protein
MMVGETTAGPEAGQPAPPWWVLAMQEASDRMVGESVPVAEAATLAAVSIRTGPAPTMRDVLVRQLKCGLAA